VKNTYDSASNYYRSTTLGATAMGQVIALYDGILRDLHRAIDAIAAGKNEQRVSSANHALLVIGELQSVLDFERGAEAARHLDSFYNVTRAMITNASVTSSVERFQELIAMFARIRAAWSQVERTVAPSEPKDRPHMPKPSSKPAQNTSLPTDSSEGSGPGRWMA
jgi:flagellar secretion chaperone FliS